MNGEKILLLIDNNPMHVACFREALVSTQQAPFAGEFATTLCEGLQRLQEKKVWAIFANLSLPDSQGLDTLDKLLGAASGVPALIMGAEEQEGVATEAMRRGAKDYLLEGHIDTYGFIRAIRNMSERKVAEEVLFAEKERAQVTLSSIGDAVLSTDISGNVTYLNAPAEEMTGWSCGDAQGKPFAEVFDIIDAQTRKAAPDPMERAIRENKTVKLTPSCILVRRDGCEFSIEDSAAPIHARSGAVAGAVIVFHDVSMSTALTAKLAHLAKHDGLTNLPNRMLLTDRINQAIATARRNGTRLAVMYLDLDGFKNINDSLGHDAGDKILQSVATGLVSCVRSSDTVSRQGGDEFVVLLSEISHAADASITARKILHVLSLLPLLGETSLHVTLSIGLSTYPEDGCDAETLIKNADTAMYQAKESSRNNYRFYKRAMNARTLERQSIEADLRRAIDRNEFVLHYQPKINLETGRIAGFEALVRWAHPRKGLVPPAHFIPVAEDSGLILPIGKWVLTEACRQVKEWLDAGLRAPPVSVNVSALEFRSADFVEGVRAILKETGLKPSYLELELTETVLMQRLDSTSAVLKKLKFIGVRFAVDDFGTGYSSLSYLKKFPIDSLKIDRSFVSDIAAHADDATIVRAVITMGKSLKKCVIAEGVETEDQMKFLKASGCDEAQGFYFSRPVASPQVIELLELGVAWLTPHGSSRHVDLDWLI